LAAIGALYADLKLPPPRRTALVRDVRAGIRREKTIAPEGKTPLRAAELRRMLGALSPSIRGCRDRALLLLGFCGAFRRSELAALEVRDVAFTAEGLKVRLRQSDRPRREGRTVAIPRGERQETCPVTALRIWLAEAGITSGPVFREVNRHAQVGESLTGGSIARIVKRAAAAAGLEVARYSGHSLRAGFVTEAAAHGARERDIMRVTGHRSERMLRRYIREEDLFVHHPGRGML
jgi:integrase